MKKGRDTTAVPEITCDFPQLIVSGHVGRIRSLMKASRSDKKNLFFLIILHNVYNSQGKHEARVRHRGAFTVNQQQEVLIGVGC